MGRLARCMVLALAAGTLVGLPAAARAAGEVVANDSSQSGALRGSPWGVTITADSSVGQTTFEVQDPPNGSVSNVGSVWCTSYYGGTCQTSFTYTPDDPAFLGTATIDFTAAAGGFSDTGTASITYVDDVTPPACEFAVFGLPQGTDRWSSVLDVTARLIASDTQSGIKSVRISNTSAAVNGMLTTYQEFPLRGGDLEFFDWSLLNGTGGSSEIGKHTVYAQCSDQFDNWTPVIPKEIGYDPIDPVIGPIGVSFSPRADGIPIRLTFTVTDKGGSGASPLELQQSRDGGAWNADPHSLNATYVDVETAAGHTYRFRIRARDDAGNLGPWTYTRTFKPARYSEASASVHYTGTWHRVYYYDVGFYTAYATRSGATARLRFTGRSIGWLAVVGAARGKAAIYIDGRYVKTVDLRVTSKSVKIAYQKTWSASGTHTILVKVLGTSGRPRVEYDEFDVIR